MTKFQMKNLIIAFLVIFFAACKDKNSSKEEVAPDYSTEFVGEYVTQTVNGGNSTSQNWVVTRLDKNLLNIIYTVDYTLRDQGLEVKRKFVYTLKNVKAIDKLNFTISEDANYTDDGFDKVRNVQGNGLKITDANGNIKIGVTFRFSDIDGTNVSNSDYLEFKKK